MSICGSDISEFAAWEALHPSQVFEESEQKLFDMVDQERIWQDRDSSNDARSSEETDESSSEEEIIGKKSRETMRGKIEIQDSQQTTQIESQDLGSEYEHPPSSQPRPVESEDEEEMDIDAKDNAPEAIEEPDDVDELDEFEVDPEEKEFLKELLPVAPKEEVEELKQARKPRSRNRGKGKAHPEQETSIDTFAREHPFWAKSKWNDEELGEFEMDVHEFAKAAGLGLLESTIQVARAVGSWKKEKGIIMLKKDQDKLEEALRIIESAGLVSGQGKKRKLDSTYNQQAAVEGSVDTTGTGPDAKRRRKEEKKARRKAQREKQNGKAPDVPKLNLKSSQEYYVQASSPMPQAKPKHVSHADAIAFNLPSKAELQAELSSNGKVKDVSEPTAPGNPQKPKSAMSEETKERKRERRKQKKAKLFQGPTTSSYFSKPADGVTLNAYNDPGLDVTIPSASAQHETPADIQEIARKARLAVKQAALAVEETVKENTKISGSENVDRQDNYQAKSTTKKRNMRKRRRNKNALPESELGIPISNSVVEKVNSPKQVDGDEAPKKKRRERIRKPKGDRVVEETGTLVNEPDLKESEVVVVTGSPRVEPVVSSEPPAKKRRGDRGRKIQQISEEKKMATAIEAALEQTQPVISLADEMRKERTESQEQQKEVENENPDARANKSEAAEELLDAVQTQFESAEPLKKKRERKRKSKVVEGAEEANSLLALETLLNDMPKINPVEIVDTPEHPQSAEPAGKKPRQRKRKSRDNQAHILEAEPLSVGKIAEPAPDHEPAEQDRSDAQTAGPLDGDVEMAGASQPTASEPLSELSNTNAEKAAGRKRDRVKLDPLVEDQDSASGKLLLDNSDANAKSDEELLNGDIDERSDRPSIFEEVSDAGSVILGRPDGNRYSLTEDEEGIDGQRDNGREQRPATPLKRGIQVVIYSPSKNWVPADMGHTGRPGSQTVAERRPSPELGYNPISPKGKRRASAPSIGNTAEFTAIPVTTTRSRCNSLNVSESSNRSVFLSRDSNGRFAWKPQVKGENGEDTQPQKRRRTSSVSASSSKKLRSVVRNEKGQFAPKSSSPVQPRSSPPHSQPKTRPTPIRDSTGKFTERKQTRIQPPVPTLALHDQCTADIEKSPSTLKRDWKGRFAPKNGSPTPPPNASVPSAPKEQKGNNIKEERGLDNDDLPNQKAKSKRPPAKSPYFTPPISPSESRKIKIDNGEGPSMAKTPKKSALSKSIDPGTPEDGESVPSSQESPKKRSPGKLVSCIPFPPLSSPHFGLIQEKLAHDPFRLLVAVTFLIRTHGKHAIPVFFELMEKYPSPESLVDAKKEDIVPIIRHLGLQNQRASTYQTYAKIWLQDPPMKDKRYPVRGYPDSDSARDVKKGEVLTDDDERHAWEIGHMTQGPYAIDSWRIFCRDVLRGVAESWNGEGTSEGFQPEWMRVVPEDKELRAYLRWMWLKEGFEWDPFTGEKEVASPELMKAAMEGRIAWDDRGGMRILNEVMNAGPNLSQFGNLDVEEE